MLPEIKEELPVPGRRQNAVNNAVDNSSNSGGGTATDTRVSFTVSLGYNDDLMRAELERKGLDNESIIPKLEVNN